MKAVKNLSYLNKIAEELSVENLPAFRRAVSKAFNGQRITSVQEANALAQAFSALLNTRDQQQLQRLMIRIRLFARQQDPVDESKQVPVEELLERVELIFEGLDTSDKK